MRGVTAFTSDNDVILSLVPRRPDLFNARERKRGSLVCEVTCAMSQTFHRHTSVAVSTKKEVSTAAGRRNASPSHSRPTIVPPQTALTYGR